MKRVLSISVGETALKKSNRKYFEDQLIKRMGNVIRDIGFEDIYKEQGKIYIEADKNSLEQMKNKLKNVFGIVYISPCIKVGKEVGEIEEGILEIVKETMEKQKINTFKVETKRIDKKFPIKSPDFSSKMGGFVLRNFPELKVNVHNPDMYVYVDIKNQSTYVYTERVEAYGGLPIGTSGKGLLLLSGGIDSPVAGFLMGKRGMEISAIHYHSYPFTSERSEEKVKELARILSRYVGQIKMYSVNILEIQKAINENCNEKEMTILTRRFMMKIAEKVAKEENLDALVTGESLGQVASQTVQGINVTNNAVTSMPVLRPLIAMDKVDIIDISREIESYETSILPYEDCCTVFLPKHPVTSPKVEDIEASEKNLNVEELVDNAIENMKITNIN